MTATGDVAINPYKQEPVNKLMNAVIYGGDYEKMTDNPVKPNAPANAQQYFDTIKNNMARTAGTMIIELVQVNAKWRFTIKLDGVATYQDDDFNPGTVGNLNVQSHWGSGVRFKNMDSVKY